MPMMRGALHKMSPVLTGYVNAKPHENSEDSEGSILEDQSTVVKKPSFIYEISETIATYLQL